MSMALFSEQFAQLRAYLNDRRFRPDYAEIRHVSPCRWPSGARRSVVFSDETAVELGAPDVGSASFLIWSDGSDEVRDGLITIIGPDIRDCPSRVPFGKAVMVVLDGGVNNETLVRYRDLDGVRFEIELRGYMVRALPQHGREWSRVSREAVEQGFSFITLGGAIIDALHKKEYVKAVEVLFVTSSGEDLAGLAGIADGALRIVSAMSRLLEEDEHECERCDNSDVCAQVDELRRLRDERRAVDR